MESDRYNDCGGVVNFSDANETVKYADVGIIFFFYRILLFGNLKCIRLLWTYFRIERIYDADRFVFGNIVISTIFLQRIKRNT